MVLLQMSDEDFKNLLVKMINQLKEDLKEKHTESI